VFDDFERRVSAALRAPVADDARARERIMQRVRRAAGEGQRPVRRGQSWQRLSRYSIIGLGLAAGLSGVSSLSALAPSASRDGGSGASVAILGDTVAATLHDTLRLVRLMFDAPSARRVAVVGDFNDWGARPTPLTRDGDRQWSVTLALHAGEHRYAFVVDETRWVPDPRDERRVRGADEHVYLLLNVARAAN